MKIPYSDIVKYIPEIPSIGAISEKLFQLGHEHEVEESIFNIEFTPNRGDCLSLIGILRDLALFYEIKKDFPVFPDELKKLNLNFIDNTDNTCSFITFLKIDIDDKILDYKDCLKSYYEQTDNVKNNFFTDISNYISYETGQPTHCYDAKAVGSKITLDLVKGKHNFRTLLDENIELFGNNLVFKKDNEIINLAGIMGGKSTSCSENTRSVLIECASFNPEAIVGKAIKYNIKSDAAHKFERGVDPCCHDFVLRRFLKLVQDHANVKSVEIFTKDNSNYSQTKIKFDIDKISKILGIKPSEELFSKSLSNLGFKIDEKLIHVPSHRNDIKTLNDIAEEIARAIGYDSIRPIPIKINSNSNQSINLNQDFIRDYLISKGFFEVINNPFVDYCNDYSIAVDNPLDSKSGYLRTNLKESLIKNLLYNERRQKDSIKIFEISDIYQIKNNEVFNEKVLALIVSGRMGKNYLDFSKIVDDGYIYNLLKDILPIDNIKVENILRENLDTKLKNKIYYCELAINDTSIKNDFAIKNKNKKFLKIKYVPISEFPSSNRDLSFSVKNKSKFKDLESFILSYKHDFLKEVFIFDFFDNKKNNEIKIGFRFIFQSNISTLTDIEINSVMKVIIEKSIRIDGVSVPGYEV